MMMTMTTTVTTMTILICSNVPRVHPLSEFPEFAFEFAHELLTAWNPMDDAKIFTASNNDDTSWADPGGQSGHGPHQF